MIIALPAGHEHLADALVRDVGFRKLHIDDPVRQLMVAIDPFVEQGVQLANMGRSPRLSSRLATHDGDWDKAIMRAPEIRRLLEAFREHMPIRNLIDDDTDMVITGVMTLEQRRMLPEDTLFVGIEDGRPLMSLNPAIDMDYLPNKAAFDLMIGAGGVVDQQIAVVEYARSLRVPAMAGGGAAEFETNPVTVTMEPPPRMGPDADPSAFITLGDPPTGPAEFDIQRLEDGSIIATEKVPTDPFGDTTPPPSTE